MLTGLAPAVIAARHRPSETLREGGRGAGGGRRGGRIRDVLVVAEIALAIVLLIGAGLMLRTFSRLLEVDPGVDVERIWRAHVRSLGAILDRNIQSAVSTDCTHDGAYHPSGFGCGDVILCGRRRGFGLGRVFLLEGQPEPPATADHPLPCGNVVTPDYFEPWAFPY